MNNFIMDLHTHTLASVHAYSSLIENARAAKENGLEIMGVSDHGYGMPETTQRSYWLNLGVIPDYVEGVRLLKGGELNIYNRKGDIYEEPLLGHLDYVIASLHGNVYEYDTRDIDDYTDAIVNCLDRHPDVCILGHPDDGRYPLDYEAVVSACKRNGVVMEVNTSSLSPTGFRLNARENIPKYLEICKREGVPIIVDSDAHFAYLVGAFDPAIKLLEECDFPEELIINTSWKKLEQALGINI